MERASQNVQIHATITADVLCLIVVSPHVCVTQDLLDSHAVCSVVKTIAVVMAFVQMVRVSVIQVFMGVIALHRILSCCPRLKVAVTIVLDMAFA